MKKIKIEVNGQWQEIEISNKSHAEFEKAVKPEFKVGEWVIEPKDEWLVRITKTEPDPSQYYPVRYHYYGFTDGDWVDDASFNVIGGFRHATEDEIKAHLIKEAEKRGFGKGVINNACFPDYSSCYDGSLHTMNDSGPCYESDTDSIRMGGGIIYHKGEWAEIISQPTTIKLNDSHEAEICDGFIKVGCQEFTFKAIKKLNKAIKSWQTLKD